MSTVTVDIEDTLGEIVTGDDNTVVLTVATGPGGLLGTVSVNAVSGVATFSTLSIDVAGSYTVKATDSTDSLTQTSSSFTISPAVAFQLVFTAQPTSGTAGTALAEVDVTVTDTYGNVETLDNSSLIALTDASGSLTGGGAVKTSGGVAVFTDLVVTKAGSDQLTGADSTDGGVSNITSNSFTIDPAAVDHMVFTTEPAGVTAGQKLVDVAVTLYDTYGNVETLDNASSISLTDTTGTLTGGGAIDTTAGVAAFGDLVVTKTGSDQLTATDSTDAGVSALNSSSFTVISATAFQLVFTAQPPSTATAGTALSEVDVTIEDQFGNVETGDNNTVTLTDTLGGLVGTPVSVAAASGVAQFTGLTLDKAGSDKLVAADSADILSGFQSSATTVSPAAAFQLVFTAQPTTGTAGTPLSEVDVTIEDQYGNVETSDSSTVNLTDSSGTLSSANGSSPVGVAAVNGVAVFSVANGDALTVTAGGTDHLYATDSADGLSTPVASTQIKVSSPSQIVFTTEPASGTAGQTLSAVQLTIYDQYGNVATWDNSTVSLTDESGTLNGLTGVAAVGGIATFTNFNVTKAGSDYLIAADSADGFSGVQSTSFTVAPGAGYTLVYIQQPGNAEQGQTIPVQVEVEDQYGNVETSDNSSSISLTDDSGTLAGGGAVTATAGAATFSGLSVPAPFLGTDHLYATVKLVDCTPLKPSALHRDPIIASCLGDVEVGERLSISPSCSYSFF